MKCSNCGRETHGGYCDCMIVDGEFKGDWWNEEKNPNLREQKVSTLLTEIEELKNANIVLKEYNQMYLDRICKLKKDEERIKKEEERLHSQAELLQQLRERIKCLESMIDYGIGWDDLKDDTKNDRQ